MIVEFPAPQSPGPIPYGVGFMDHRGWGLGVGGRVGQIADDHRSGDTDQRTEGE
jgi:hypothetical protein